MKLNDLELDKLTASTLNTIVNRIGDIGQTGTMEAQYTALLDCQKELKKLYTKGYNAGVGETMLKQKGE